MSNQTPVKTDKCLLCRTEVRDAFWLYLWRKKSGYCCRRCGEAIHDAGYKILRSLENILIDSGLKLIDSKEKFGFYRLSMIAETQFQHDLAISLFKEAVKQFPEFSFDLSVSLYKPY